MKDLLESFELKRLEELADASKWVKASHEELQDLARIVLEVKRAKPVCWIYNHDIPDLRKGIHVRLQGRINARPEDRITGCPYEQPKMTALYALDQISTGINE